MNQTANPKQQTRLIKAGIYKESAIPESESFEIRKDLLNSPVYAVSLKTIGELIEWIDNNYPYRGEWAIVRYTATAMNWQFKSKLYTSYAMSELIDALVDAVVELPIKINESSWRKPELINISGYCGMRDGDCEGCIYTDKCHVLMKITTTPPNDWTDKDIEKIIKGGE